MTRETAFVHLVQLVACSIALSACLWTGVPACDQDGDGLCPPDDFDDYDPKVQTVADTCGGRMDNEEFYLRVYNCTTGEAMIYFNDYAIGTVDALHDSYEDIPGDPSEQCGVRNLGAFPQCANGTIGAAVDGSMTNLIVWSDDAVTYSPDSCWVTLILASSPETVPDDVPDIQPPAMECQWLNAYMAQPSSRQAAGPE